MALIKSALEIALEKTRDLKVDTAALENSRVKAEGKKAAGKFLESPDSFDLTAAIKACDPAMQFNMKEGVVEILSSNLQLPATETALEKIASIGAGFEAVAMTSALIEGTPAAEHVKQLYGQIADFLRKYLDDMKNVEQVIRKQWAPKLREKERQMAARMGPDFRLDPMSDPEFAAYYKQNVDGLRQQYLSALENAKADLGELCGIVKAE